MMTQEKLKHLNLLSRKIDNLDELICHFGHKVRVGENYSIRKFNVFRIRTKKRVRDVRISFADTVYGDELFVDHETVDLIVESLKTRREQIFKLFEESPHA